MEDEVIYVTLAMSKIPKDKDNGIVISDINSKNTDVFIAKAAKSIGGGITVTLIGTDGSHHYHADIISLGNAVADAINREDLKIERKPK